MRTVSGLGLACILTIASVGCGGRMVMVPPRIDLAQHDMIGIIDFACSAKGELGPLVTRRFTEVSRQDQGLVRVVWLGSEKEALRSIGRHRLDAEAFRALGREHDVKAIFVGTLTISDVRPDIRIAGLRSGSLSAQVDATLAVQMIEASTGASFWNRSAGATQSVGQISVLGGKDISFDADDPERAYSKLVNSLVEQVTRDFRARWVRQ